MTTVTVISAGLRSPSSTKLLADQLADAVRRQLGAVDIHDIEVRDLAHEITDALLTGFPTGALKDALEQVTARGLHPVTSLVRRSSLEDVFLELSGRQIR